MLGWTPSCISDTQEMVVATVTLLVDPAYGDKEHRITMRCSQSPSGDVVLEVEDNGAGIPEDVHHKVFESFFSTKGTEGTGLGLLVVQKVVNEHGGQITFTSEEGKGTRFRAVLPGRPES